MYIGLREKYPLFCEILIRIKLYRYIFEKYSNVKFHGNPSNGSRVVPCRRRDGRNGQTWQS